MSVLTSICWHFQKLCTLQTTPTPENNVEEANEIKKKELKTKSITKKAEEKEESKPKEPETKPKAEVKPKEAKAETKPSAKAPEIVEPKETIRKPSVAKVHILHKFYTHFLTLSHVLTLSLLLHFLSSCSPYSLLGV